MPELPEITWGKLTPEKFLRKYWQKKPLLLKQAFPHYRCPLTPNDLAALACMDNVSSRLVFEQKNRKPWQVNYGPFDESVFNKLPKSCWTLLVQGVDRHDEDIADLLNAFNFIPRWRIDDIMISYAPENGSVGPHLDSYDVFLLQGLGRRRWLLNTTDYTEQDFRPDLELRIIDNFKSKQEYTLEPGDMLYLPPGVAHHGIALEPCLTLSIGFLAPSKAELVQQFADEIISSTVTDQRYTDPGLKRQKSNAEISHDSLRQLRTMMQQAVSDERQLDQWLGKYLTSSDAPVSTGKRKLSLETFKTRLKSGWVLKRKLNSKFAYIKNKKSIDLFINGEHFPFSVKELSFIRLIGEKMKIDNADLKKLKSPKNPYRFLHQLYSSGVFDFVKN